MYICISQMKCIVASHYGGRDAFGSIFSVAMDRPRPVRGKGQLLLQVQACSLAPGDVRTLSGWTKLVQKPAFWPFVPGGDVVGVVVEADPDCDKFEVGNSVVSRFEGTPLGGLAEYAVVSTQLSGLKPAEVSIVDAAAVPASVTVALLIAKALVREGDRVLVIGGSGGVGSHLVQLLKRAGASYVAATSKTHPALLRSFAVVDRVIDREEECWHTLADFKECPFDLVFDLAAPGKPNEAWGHAKGILKSGWHGGRFVTLVGPTPHYKVQTVLQALFFMRKLVLGGVGPKVMPWLPKYAWATGGLASSIKDELYAEIFTLVEESKLRIVTDPAGPFPFTAEGVRDAFVLQESRHTHGKVVVLVGAAAAAASAADLQSFA